MGVNASTLVNPSSGNKESNDAMREQLDVLMKLADARLDSYQHQLEMMFVDKESEMKKSVPGKRALRFHRHIGVNVGKKLAEDGTMTTHRTKDAVYEAVNSFICSGKKPGTNAAAPAGGETEDGMTGFKSVVYNAFSTSVEDTSAGENADRKFFVCIQHNAVVRVDVMTYRYNFQTAAAAVAAQSSSEQTPGASTANSSAQGTFIEKYQSIFAYIICVSVVDHRDISDDEIIYLASEFAGDDVREFDAYLDMLIRVWNKLRVNGISAITAK